METLQSVQTIFDLMIKQGLVPPTDQLTVNPNEEARRLQMIRFLQEQTDLPFSRAQRNIVSQERAEIMAKLRHYDALQSAIEYVRAFGVAIACSARELEPKVVTFTHKLAQLLMDTFGAPSNGPGRFRIVNGGGNVGLMKETLIGAMQSEHYGERNCGVVGLGIKLNFGRKEGVADQTIWGANHPSFNPRLKQFEQLMHGFVALPGGIGSVLEIMDIVQKKQVHHVEAHLPILLHESFKPTWDTLFQTMHNDRVNADLTPTVSKKDYDLVQFFSTPEEVVAGLMPAFEAWKTLRAGFHYVDEK